MWWVSQLHVGLSASQEEFWYTELVYLLVNTLPRFLTWCVVIIHSNREVPRHVGNRVPPLYCEIDTCVLIIQLRKEETKQGINMIWHSMQEDDIRKNKFQNFISDFKYKQQLWFLSDFKDHHSGMFNVPYLPKCKMTWISGDPCNKNFKWWVSGTPCSTTLLYPQFPLI